MSETISAKKRWFDPNSIECVAVKIGKGSANAPSNDTVMPAGTPVFASAISGQEWDVFNATGIAAAMVTTKGTAGTSTTDVAKVIGILMEPWTVSATQTKIKVAFAGKFYLAALRENVGATILPSTVTDKMFREANGHCIFAEETHAAVWA